MVINRRVDLYSCTFPCNIPRHNSTRLQWLRFQIISSELICSPSKPWSIVQPACRFNRRRVGWNVLSCLEFLYLICRRFTPLISATCDVCWIFPCLFESKIKPSFFFQYCLSIFLILFDCFVNFFFQRFVHQCFWSPMKYFNIGDSFNFQTMINWVVKYKVVTISQTQSFVDLSNFVSIWFFDRPCMSRNVVVFISQIFFIRCLENRIDNIVFQMFLNYFIKIFWNFNIIIDHKHIFICWHFERFVSESRDFFVRLLNENLHCSIFRFPWINQFLQFRHFGFSWFI